MASQPDEFSSSYVAMNDPNLTSTTGEIVDLSKAPKIGKIGMSFRTNQSGQTEFSMKNISGDPFVYTDPATGISYIAIWQHSIIEIELSNFTDWEFDKNSELFSPKSFLYKKYYHVRYNPSASPLKNIVLHVTPTGNVDPLGENHPFNIFLLFTQPLGHKLPVTIDPDIKNPPPHSHLNIEPAPQNTPVPII